MQSGALHAVRTRYPDLAAATTTIITNTTLQGGAARKLDAFYLHYF